MSQAVAPAAPRQEVVPWLGGTDHKRVALGTAVTCFAFFLLSGLFALTIRAELAEPGLQLVSRDTYDQLSTMHGSVMIFLVVTPLALALGLYLVPLQVGASRLAAPRLALLGLWLLIGGGLTLHAGFLAVDGAAKTGWTAYPPLSSTPATPGSGQDLWIVGVILAAVAVALFAISVLGTLLQLRAPGMTLLRMPPFCWAMLVTCLLVLAATPPLAVALTLLEVDRHGGGVFDGSVGPITYQHLFWFYGHPDVYVMFFPFLGIVAEVVATFSRRAYVGYRALVLALLVFSVLSMAVWGHHMFATGAVSNRYFALTSTALLVVAGVEYLGVIGTMVGGRIELATPMLFALGFLAQFVIGGVTGIILASPVLDYHLTDSYFVVAHFHYTLFGGSVFGLFAGVYYWFPKATGALLREGLGRLQLVLLVVGTNLTFFPMFVLGYDGMPRRVADYDPSFERWNQVATAGSAVIALAIVVFLVNVAVSLRHRRPAGDDPWSGQTLEWATTSPPPRHNFDALPPIRSPHPLLDLRAEAAR